MTIQERVQTLVTGRARPICDDCVADYLAISRRQVVSATLRSKQKGVRRFIGRCSGCCTYRRVMSPESARKGMLEREAVD